MAAFTINWPAVVVGLSVAYILRYIWREIDHARRARQLGCKPAFVRPSRLPFGIDTMLRYMRSTEAQNQQNDDLVLYDELGQRPTWYQNILGSWHHVTADPKNVQAILATQFNDFELGPLRFGMFGPFIGKGIFTSDGKDWSHSRGLLRPQFTRAQVADLTLEESHVQSLFDCLTVESNSWTATVNLAPLFFNLTLDSATEFLFGQSVHSQKAAIMMSKNSKSGNTTTKALEWAFFGQCFDNANLAACYRGRLLDFYYLYSPPSFRKDCREVHRFADYYVRRALEADLSSSNGAEKVVNKKNTYVFLDELVKMTKNPQELRGQLLNILLAGRDTTAGLLGWTFYLLARNPEIYSTLRKAIVVQFGAYPSTAAISFETLKSCTYLQNVMSEVLRLHPVVPENSRRAVRDTTLPRGGGLDGASPIYVRKGSEVAYNVHVMHRRTDIWESDANEFKPERWNHLKTGWEYLPFNGGPQICLGQQFALTEAGYVIARIVQRFDRLENMDPSPITKHRYTATTSPVNAFVRFHEAVSS
ncbi:hypothetical protein LTR96_011283 [Exophiala xenobiotica]|nr:hypothetical protein LTR72_011440 [Exophiala xenobiotica]KAK5263304.1 hypothetical protein LTR96_011283 [Exophiala xenobiotica]KAK5284837.1 hypothetical protein LTR14_011447 [Exophiala xenobiotica]KAK5312085.1 hypothetical protein LTR93_011476 [Exophiala xenobiotica]KAK5332571.1 hypothetical protein LTR98_011296 [Exophiala xenobiotica]